MKSRLIFSIATAATPEIIMLDELLSAGAFRVYNDTAELHESLDELGFDL